MKVDYNEKRKNCIKRAEINAKRAVRFRTSGRCISVVAIAAGIYFALMIVLWIHKGVMEMVVFNGLLVGFFAAAAFFTWQMANQSYIDFMEIRGIWLENAKSWEKLSSGASPYSTEQE